MRRTWVSMTVAVLAALALIAGCQPGGGTGGGTGGDAGPIKIGAVLAVTGPSAPLGEAEKAALEMLVAKINAAGGVNGRQIEVMIEDNESDPQKAQQAATKLIEQDQVIALIGGTSSPDSLAIIPEATKAGVPFLSMAASSKISQPPQPLVFQTPPRNGLIVERVYRHLVDNLKVKSFAVIYDSNDFGKGGYDGLKAIAGTEGPVRLVAAESYDSKATDLSSQVNKLKAANPDVIVGWGTNPGPAIAVKTMRELGMKQPFVGSHGIANMAFIDLAGEGKTPQTNPANGTVFPAGAILIPDEASLRPERKAVLDTFGKDYEAKVGKKPNTFAGHAYDALMILVEAMKKAGADDKAAIRDAIERTTGFAGVQGVFNYSATDHNGLTLNDVTLIEVVDGKWKAYKPAQ